MTPTDWPAGWRPAPVGGPTCELEWFEDTRHDELYPQCACGRDWPHPPIGQETP